MPKVSIIVPNYNYARFLTERMESIYSQTFKDYEIILLDDGSADGSQELLKEMAKDPRVSELIINDENTGSPFRQWKRGIEAAKGEYIWIAEADDMCAPRFLERSVTALDNNPEAVIAFMGSISIDKNGKRNEYDFDRWTDRKHISRAGTEVVHDGKRFVVHNQYWRCYVYNASGTVFRKSAYGDGTGFEECFKMKNSGDWLFWTIMATKGDIIEIYTKLNFIRRHDCNQTEKGFNSGNIYFEDIKVLKYIEQHCHVGIYRKIIRHGEFYKMTRRLNLPEEIKHDLFEAMSDQLGISRKEFIIERIHKFLWNIFPFLLSTSKDRL